MHRIKTFVFLISSFFLFSCIGRQAYYVNPFNGITPPYRTIPMKSDSVGHASFINFGFSGGNANDWYSDHKLSLSTSFSRSHNFGNFQAHYGLGMTIGSYTVSRFDSVYSNSTVDYKIINQNAGKYFFGGWGFDGGINIVSTKENFEWRILGVETSLRHEFGDFLRFRQRLPDSAASLIIRNPDLGTVGLFTEFVMKSKDESRIGLKFNYGSVVGNSYRFDYIRDSYFYKRPVHFNYLGMSLSWTKEAITAYISGDFAGKSRNCFLGCNVRLGK
jgi:hypothetical protein